MGRGRPRRTSASSVETIDDNELPYNPERKLLRPLLPEELGDQDNWPCFKLHDAVAYYRTADGRPETHWMGNLLHATYDGPFFVRGRLQVTKGHENRLLPGASDNSYITLDCVTQFSLLYDENVATIWTGGACGWYELFPAQAYLPIFRHMSEAVVLYFTMETILDENSASMSLDELLFRYAVHVGECLTIETAKDRCRIHAPFLLSHCEKEEAVKASGVRWSRTKFWRFLRAECGDILAILRERDKLAAKGQIPPPTTRRPTPPLPAPPREKSPSFEPSPPRNRGQRIVPQVVDLEMLDVESEASSRPSTTRQRRSTHVDSPTPGRAEPAAAAVSFQPNPQIDSEALVLLMAVFEDIWIDCENNKRNKSKILPSTIRTSMFQKCSTAYDDPLKIVGYFSRELSERLPAQWEGTPFMDFVRQEAQNPDPTLGHIPYGRLLQKLGRRKSKTTAGHVSMPSSSFNAPAQTASLPERSRHRRRTTDSQIESPSPDGGEDTRIEAQETPPASVRRAGRGRPPRDGRPPKPIGKTPRLSLVARKRGLSDGETETIDFAHRSKAPRTTAQIEEEAPFRSDSKSNSYGSSDSDPESSSDTKSPSIPKVPIVIRAEQIPSTEPHGPEGTWVCDEEECDFIVRAADEPAGRALVEEHVEQHGKTRDDEKEKLINYAVAEGTSRHLPVSHLLDKIRKLGERAEHPFAAGFDIDHEPSEPKFPKPIKRRLGW